MYTVQGGYKNYHTNPGEVRTIEVPERWKSAPDHPTAYPVFITQAEMNLLREANLHGYADPSKIGEGRGPGELPSYNGYGEQAGGVGGGGLSDAGDYSGGYASDANSVGAYNPGTGRFDSTGFRGRPENEPLSLAADEAAINEAANRAAAEDAEARDFGPVNLLSSVAERIASYMTLGIVDPELDGKSLIGPDRPQGVYVGSPFGRIGPQVGFTSSGVGFSPGLAADMVSDYASRPDVDDTSPDLQNAVTNTSPEQESVAGLTLSSNPTTPDGPSDMGGNSREGEGYTPPAIQTAYAAPVTSRQQVFTRYGDVYDTNPSYKQGGLVSAQGDNTMANTEELILIATDPMYDTADPGVLQQGVAPQNAQPMNYMMNPSFAEGGVVSMGGPPQPQAGLAPQGAPQGQPISMQEIEADMQRMMQNNPQEILKIKTGIEQLMQAGELTAQELNMAIQLATAAAQNPQLYPQLRQFAIQQGLAEEQELPQGYDQGLVFSILLAGKALQMQGGQMQGGQPVPQSDGQPPQASMVMGGGPLKSNNNDGSVAINAHKGEYIIPENVVLAKGTNFFDKMIGKDGTAKA